MAEYVTMRRILLLQSVFTLFFTSSTFAFYLPGIAPRDYGEGAPIEIFADKLSSAVNKVPYDYYSMKYCPPGSGKIKSNHLGLGEILMGDRKEPTPYEINMKVLEQCKVLCQMQYNDKEINRIIKRIKDQYYVYINMDSMPAIMRYTNYFVKGFPVGYMSSFDNEVVLINHLNIKVLVHQPKSSAKDGFLRPKSDEPLYRVVGFEVVPMSIQHKQDEHGQLTTCPTNLSVAFPRLTLNDKVGLNVVYSYSVEFEDSPIRWATRWDSLLNASPEFKAVQWFSLINSSILVLFLTGVVSMVLSRTVYRDLSNYNDPEQRAELAEESGWKLIYGDVFRTPFLPGFLAVMYGSGIHIAIMTLSTLLFSLLGFMSPADRGGLLTGLLIFWVLTSSFSGFMAARLYNDVGGINKRSVTIGSSFFFSGLVFTIFFLLNLLLNLSRSTSAVSFLTLVYLLVLWFGISVPLNLIGSYMGYKMEPRKFPCRVNNVPREIHPYSAVPPSIYPIMSGMLPFAIIFIELVFILNSVWQNQTFYMFGFLFFVILMLFLSCAEVSVVLIYVLLTKEDYHWWWRSFFAAGSTGLYIFLYSILYLCTQSGLKGMHFTSIILYFSYMFVISFGSMLMTGSVGFHATYWFVRSIYGAVRVD